MKQDRFLQAILAGIALVAVLAVVLFFTRSRQVDYVADGTPEAAAQNFVLALHRQDYERAYAYLADEENKPTLEQFRQYFFTQTRAIADTSVQILTADITGDQAQVTLSVLHGGGGLLSEPYRETTPAVLERQGDEWKIVQMPFPYWSWDWFQQTVPGKPLPRELSVD
ncbi:MAG TPA: hypothetical protein VFF68_09330 [Anaerolineaceae bacterium]|nr:hypothetical protein [Anaerolineaceae bacterium]